MTTMTPEIKLARRNARRALRMSRRGIDALVELHGLPETPANRARLELTNRQLDAAFEGLVAASITLEPAILDATPAEVVPLMRARLIEARRDRNGELLMAVVSVAVR